MNIVYMFKDIKDEKSNIVWKKGKYYPVISMRDGQIICYYENYDEKIKHGLRIEDVNVIYKLDTCVHKKKRKCKKCFGCGGKKDE